MPRLTVIMAAYNAASTVKGSTTAALLSMPRDSELIVTIDGPDSATLQQLEKIGDKRLKVRQNNDNIGTSLRHQEVLKHSDSDWVANIDADDLCFPWRFRATLPYLRRSHDMVFGTAVRFGDEFPKATYPRRIDSNDLALALPFFVPVLHSSMVAKRTLITEAGGYRKIGYAEDWDLWLRCAALGARMVKVATPVTAYRIHETQMSQNIDKYASVHDSTMWRESRNRLLNYVNIPVHDSSTTRMTLTATELESAINRLSARNSRYLGARMTGQTDIIPS